MASRLGTTPGNDGGPAVQAGSPNMAARTITGVNDEQTRAKAARLVTEHVQDYDSEWAAITAVSARFGRTAETLRRWVR